MDADRRERTRATRRLGVFLALALSLSACNTLPSARQGTRADPCQGNDPAAQARAWQGISPSNPTNPYTGKDSFGNFAVREGTVLYALTPGGTPGFAVDAYTLAQAEGQVARYYGLLQISTDPGTDGAGIPRQLREQVRAFEVSEAICVAFGTAMANPQFGPGGGKQYYVVPEDRSKLSPGASRPI